MLAPGAAFHDRALRTRAQIILTCTAAAERIIEHELDAAAVAALALVRWRVRAPARLSRKRRRRLAVYLIAVELQFRKLEIARALGVSRQAVQQACASVEALRECAAVDALLDRCRARLNGEA